MTEEQKLKKEIKEVVNKVSRWTNNTRIINAVVKFIIADRANETN